MRAEKNAQKNSSHRAIRVSSSVYLSVAIGKDVRIKSISFVHPCRSLVAVERISIIMRSCCNRSKMHEDVYLQFCLVSNGFLSRYSRTGEKVLKDIMIEATDACGPTIGLLNSLLACSMQLCKYSLLTKKNVS